MKKFYLLFFLLLITLPLSVSALAQGSGFKDRVRDRIHEPGSMRIIKGTVERISGEEITVKVENIFAPRVGEVSDAPSTLRIGVPEKVRVVKDLERDSKLTDFKKGDQIVVMAVYDEDGGYTARAVMDPTSAMKLRERIGSRMGERFRGRDDRGRLGMRDRLKARFQRAMHPPVSATFLGLGDDQGTVKLEIKGPYRPPVEILGDRDFPTRHAPKRPLPEPRIVTVKVGEGAKFFLRGEKASLSDFKKGSEVVALIRRGSPAVDGQPILLFLGDEQSAEKFAELMRDRMQGLRDWRGDRQNMENRGAF